MGAACQFCGIEKQNVDYLIGGEGKPYICPACVIAASRALAAPGDVIDYHTFLLYRQLSQNKPRKDMTT